jgi:hypothetical protein
MKAKSKAVMLPPCRCQGGEEIQLILILDLGTVVIVTPWPFFTPSTHWIGGWVGLRTDLDTKGKGRILCLCQGSNPGHPVCSQTLSQIIISLIPYVIFSLTEKHSDDVTNSLL